MKIKGSLSKINNKISGNTKEILTDMGYLIDKGNIKIREIVSLNPDKIDSNFKFFNNEKGQLTLLRDIKKKLLEIEKQIFDYCSVKNLSNVMGLFKNQNSSSLKDFLAVKKELVSLDTSENWIEFNPSSGEKAMLVMHSTINKNDKDSYFLDEPETSVGHKYINEIIIPKLRELAKLDKTIVITTHDANLAIRTFPIQSIFRKDCGSKKYETYVGSPLLEQMKILIEENEKLDKKSEELASNTSINWRRTSLETLEGGEQALNERLDTYGKRN